MNMDRTVLAKRLVEIAGDIEAMTQKKESMVSRMARTINAFDVGVEVEKSAKAVAQLAQDFKTHHADLITQITEMESAIDEKRDMLKAYYKTWKTETGYEKARRELLSQASTCLHVGDVLTDLADDMSLAKRESEQESYKEKYNILVSTLNEAELNKYRKILDSFFSKQITELKTGVKELDGTVKQWHDSAQAIADERGIDLPKASDSSRTAGVGDFLEALKNVIPELKMKLQKWGQNLWRRIAQNSNQLGDISQRLLAMANKAKAVMAS
jgi:hypothetical protein